MLSLCPLVTGLGRGRVDMASARSCSATMSGRRVATQCRSFVMMLGSGATRPELLHWISYLC